MSSKQYGDAAFLSVFKACLRLFRAGFPHKAAPAVF